MHVPFGGEHRYCMNTEGHEIWYIMLHARVEFVGTIFMADAPKHSGMEVLGLRTRAWLPDL